MNTTMQRETNWNVKSNTADITNGATVAEITLSHTITASNTRRNYVMSVVIQSPNAGGAYGTIRLNSFPGLGVRWKWAGYENLENAAVNTSSLRPEGTAITGALVDWTRSAFTTDEPNKKFKLKWKVELVVTDITRFVGGHGDLSLDTSVQAMNVMPIITDNIAPVRRQACIPPISAVAEALAAPIELPNPSLPTCQFPFDSLNQAITLDPASVSSVPANGDPRASTSNETRFQIRALNCEADTAYAIYFTDARAVGASKNYLSSQGALANKVNLRLFSAASNTPVSFGPAPVGSSLPGNPPGVTNSGTPANSSYVHDFYVQYVRAPGVDASAVSPGSLSASAVLTVVYP